MERHQKIFLKGQIKTFLRPLSHEHFDIFQNLNKNKLRFILYINLYIYDIYLYL
jgi:hypothetical protein